jgi:pyruvate dehydrogenase E1 component alpha subunit
MPGFAVDGQDFRAVYEAASQATSRARRGEGPTLIEAKTYRFDEHQVDLFIKPPYRTDEEIEEYRTRRDPISLYRQVLLEEGFTDVELAAIESEVADTVNQAIRFAEESASPNPATLFDHLFSHPVSGSTPRSPDSH